MRQVPQCNSITSMVNGIIRLLGRFMFDKYQIYSGKIVDCHACKYKQDTKLILPVYVLDGTESVQAIDQV